MIKKNIEIQVFHSSTMKDYNSFGIRILVNDKDICISELSKEQMLHIETSFLNVANFIKHNIKHTK